MSTAQLIHQLGMYGQVYIVWRKDAVRDVILQGVPVLLRYMKIGNIARYAWMWRKRSIDESERTDLSILKNIMKSIRKREKITGRDIVRLK